MWIIGTYAVASFIMRYAPHLGSLCSPCGQSFCFVSVNLGLTFLQRHRRLPMDVGFMALLNHA
jgi:hypothetical protein